MQHPELQPDAPMNYPMFTVPMEDARGMTSVEPHEMLREQGE